MGLFGIGKKKDSKISPKEVPHPSGKIAQVSAQDVSLPSDLTGNMPPLPGEGLNKPMASLAEPKKEDDLPQLSNEDRYKGGDVTPEVPAENPKPISADVSHSPADNSAGNFDLPPIPKPAPSVTEGAPKEGVIPKTEEKKDKLPEQPIKLDPKEIGSKEIDKTMDEIKEAVGEHSKPEEKPELKELKPLEEHKESVPEKEEKEEKEEKKEKKEEKSETKKHIFRPEKGPELKEEELRGIIKSDEEYGAALSREETEALINQLLAEEESVESPEDYYTDYLRMKHTHSIQEGPVFVTLTDYKKIGADISNSLNAIKKSEKILFDVEGLGKDQDKLLESFYDCLEEIQEKLIYVDKAFFEKL